MPIKKAALKRMRADKKRHEKNLRIANDLRTNLKKIRDLISQKKSEEARTAIQATISKLDKAAKKKIIHKNKASRTISRLNKAVNKLSA